MSWLYLSNPCASSYYPLHTVLRVPPAPGLPCALYLGGRNELAKLRRNRAVRMRTRVQRPGSVEGTSRLAYL